VNALTGNLLLIAGVLLWSFTHFMPTLFVTSRAQLIDRVGENPYKGLFSLAILASVVMMVFGWKSAEAQPVYYLGGWAMKATALLVLVGFVFFLASSLPNNLKRHVRHPQLTGVGLWALGHLLSNGEGRSLILFGGFLAWSAAQMVFSNRRDGAWSKPAAVPRKADAVLVASGLAAYAVMVFIHQWLFNVRPY
jgi:uncharacterized membrane protein